MTYDQVMKELEAAGTAQNRKVYARHGVGEKMFGVSYANFGKLQKQIKVNHVLAAQLWASGNHDARVLATMIADPRTLTDKQADTWVKEYDYYTLSDAFGGLVAKSPLAAKKAEKWHKSKDEWIASTGWRVVAQLALANPQLPDDYFDPYLELIANGIHQQKNRVRHEMNSALVAIGVRNQTMEKKAVAIAKKIGKVEVDHGETGCKTPDAAEYIAKTLAYRHKKTAKAAAKK